MHRARATPKPPDTALVESLLRPAAYDHSVTDIELIETHISWLLLAGDYAYKLKKPIALDFLDFSSLEKRHFYCDEEVRLNRPYAPEIYVDVVPVTETDGGYRFGGHGRVVDYAVRMHRFDQDLRLDRQLEDGLLVESDMKELAGSIAGRHLAATRVPPDQRDRVLALTGELMRDNFPPLSGSVDDPLVAGLRQWTEAQLAQHQDLVARRFDEGFVRDCHGDLHLGNVVRMAGGFRTFDCIEFNTDLRHIDVFCDLAFLVMDLAARRRLDMASHLLNRYLEVTGDYGGMPLFRLFYVYRCLVRAKVAVIRAAERRDAVERTNDLGEAVYYCELAGREAAARRPLLLVMHGLSGSGKTWVSSRLMAAVPAIRLRTDIERKRLAGLGETESSHSGVGEGIYAPQAATAVYARLRELALPILAAGHNVILDGTYLARAERRQALEIARMAGCQAVIVDVRAPQAALRERLSAREHGDVSEARLAVLENQQVTADPLAANEGRVVAFDNDGSHCVDALIGQLRSG
jgi:aminoglycoside phosphotransferase family enzyme/predicted kinase